MKSEVKLATQTDNPKYPAFYCNRHVVDLIVMFTSLSEGVVVKSNNTTMVGWCHTDWIAHNDADRWTRLPSGTQIILSQE